VHTKNIRFTMLSRWNR